MGADVLAPTMSGYLFDDFVNHLRRPESGSDRAELLERAWERENDDMTGGFLAAQSKGKQPLLLLNGFSPQTGCRVLTSVLVTQPEEADAADCGKNLGPNSLRLLDATIDLNAQLCADCDIRYSTAALASARFPLIGPAGYLEDAPPPDGDGKKAAEDPEGSAIQVVDGGYSDTSGASTLVELWPALQHEVDTALGGDVAKNCVSGLFLQIDNGYSSEDVRSIGQLHEFGQVLAPLHGILSVPAGVEAAARQASRTLFERGAATGAERTTGWYRISTFAHPGSSAPLGWVLSTDAKEDLDDQLRLNAGQFEAIRNAIEHPPRCTVAEP
jgi:hypothetical protein